MLKGTLVASTPSLPQGGNSWHKRFGGLSGSLDALSSPRIRVDLEGDVAVVREQPNSAPLARLRLDIGGEVRIIEGDQALARLTGQKVVPVALHLDEDRLLQRGFRLPRATPASDLRGAIGFEIERHTPFRAQDVTYGWRLEDVPGDARSMKAQVMIAQHRDLRQLLAGLLTHNLSIARLTGDIAGKEVTLEMPDELAMVRPRPRWRSRFALLTALVVVLISPPFWLQYHAEQIADEANELRGGPQVGGGTGGRVAEADLFDAVIDLRRHPEAIDTLNRLSALLPDGSWLSALAINGDDLMIEGISDDNVRLVQLLEASPGFTAVTYAAPVVRSRNDDNERFVFNLTRVSR